MYDFQEQLYKKHKLVNVNLLHKSICYLSKESSIKSKPTVNIKDKLYLRINICIQKTTLSKSDNHSMRYEFKTMCAY